MNSLRRGARRQLGISLIEALVALAVMAIGLLGIVGVQGTLRTNSDVAKQRSEALRLAQKEVESLRAFTVLDSTGASPPGYADIAASSASAAGVSTEFRITRSVSDLPDPLKGKALTVRVGWTDRLNDSSNQVQLSTVVARIAPEFAATMVVGGDSDQVGQAPKGRNRGIPLSAKDLGNGTSGFIPPGSTGGVVWVFNNSTGLITTCHTSVTVNNDLATGNIDTCSTGAALLLAGYIHYSVGPSPVVLPSATNFEVLPAEAPTLNVYVHQTAPTTGNVTCYTSTFDPVSRAYYCAMPVLLITVSPPSWSGWSGDLRFSYPTTHPAIAATTDDVEPLDRKACRFHADAAYASEMKSRPNQNYLIIRSGDGTAPHTCPTPTIQHQPTGP